MSCVRVLSLALVLVPLTLAKGDDEPSFKKLTSKEGRFTVLMPGQAEKETMNVNTPAGKLTIHLFSVEKPDGRYFAVSYVDYPAAAVQGRDASKLLDGARNGAVSRVGGKLIDEKKITVNTFPGREFRCSTRSSFFCRMKLVVVRNRLYQLIVVGDRQAIDSDESSRFIGSLAIVKPTE